MGQVSLLDDSKKGMVCRNGTRIRTPLGRVAVWVAPAEGGDTTERRARDAAFSLVEALIVVSVMLIVAAAAVPSIINSLKGYRLHSDATAIAGAMNVARMRAASQYAPYRVNLSVNSGTFSIEKLCGNTTTSSDSSCTSPYGSFSTPVLESGTQYLSQGDSLVSCRPAGVSSYPGTITADASGCGNVVSFYFNTRGSPVDATGNPLAGGGAIVYVQNSGNAVDAITVSIGGRVTVYNWSGSNSTWYQR